MIKPAVEDSGLGYECIRSTATRGNIIGQIIESLRNAHVVIADLTDQNPNVFYELGVRHSLANRTILISQSAESIPFDLRAYAFHIYDWRTDDGKREFFERVRDLLLDVDQTPGRSDNPVSDFLGQNSDPFPTPEQVGLAPVEATRAQTLAGPLSEGVNAADLGESISRTTDRLALRRILRLTRAHLLEEWPRKIMRLNAELPSEGFNQSETYAKCQPIVQTFATDIYKVEEFGLALVEAEFRDGILEIISVVEEWISMAERSWQGNSLRPVTNAPALLALRLLLNLGAKAIDQRSLAVASVLLNSPLHTREVSGQVLTKPVVERSDLFYSEAFLGWSDLTAKYLIESGWANDGLQKFFARKEDYLDGLAIFLFLTDFVYLSRHHQAIDKVRVYPSYRLVPGAREALAAFVARLSSSADFRLELAKITSEQPDQLLASWPLRVKVINDASLGERYFSTHWRIPEALS